MNSERIPARKNLPKKMTENNSKLLDDVEMGELICIWNNSVGYEAEFLPEPWEIRGDYMPSVVANSMEYSDDDGNYYREIIVSPLRPITDMDKNEVFGSYIRLRKDDSNECEVVPIIDKTKVEWNI